VRLGAWVVSQPKKVSGRHCGKVIEAEPPLGQINPSEAACAPRGQTARSLDDRWPRPTRGQPALGKQAGGAAASSNPYIEATTTGR
jgi:hypothetical protein